MALSEPDGPGPGARSSEPRGKVGPIRIGMLVAAGEGLAPWEQRLVQRIVASPNLELSMLIEAEAALADPAAGTVQGLWLKLEARLAARSRSAAGGCSLAGFARVRAGDEAAISGCGLDVILDLTDGHDTSCPAHLAAHGVWFTGCWGRHVHMAGLGAVLGSKPVSRIALWRRPPAGGPPEQVASAALNTKFIAARNGLFMAEKSVTLLLRELERLARDGLSTESEGAIFEASAPVPALQFGRYLYALGREAIGRAREKVLARARMRPGMFFLRTAEGDPRHFDPARAKEHRFAANAYQADPFLWESGGEQYCFFETYDYGTGKGHISVGRFHGGELTDVRTALQVDYHLSFPFLFEADGQLFMLPETCGARRIELWRCTRFPDKWEHHAVVMDDVMAADSSICEIDGQWWLFTNISKDPFGEMNSELHLFRIDGPALSAIEPHPLNPVVFDARTARNGGRIFELDGRFYRPSQDNSHGTYGYAINLMRIDHLSMDRYAETLERKIEPSFERGLIGCHHLDIRAGRIVIDVRKNIGGLAGRGEPCVKLAGKARAAADRPHLISAGR